MSRIITERIIITMHTDLEKLGKFRGATVDKKEMLNDGRLIDAGQKSLTSSDVNDAISAINVDAIEQRDYWKFQFDTLNLLSTQKDEDIQNLKLEIESLTEDSNQKDIRIQELLNRVEELENPPVVEVLSCTPRQGKMALAKVGLYNKALELVEYANSGGNPIPKIYWDSSTVWLREDTILVGMATQLNMTEEQIDQLFIEANKL